MGNVYADKVEILRRYAAEYPRKVMVETGLWQGHGSGHELRHQFEIVWQIDADPENCRKAVEQARGQDGCRLYALPGDSAVVLPRILRAIREPAFFWLDAHYWDDEPGPPSPLLAELDAIIAWEHGPQSVVLIDDVRQMRGQELGQEGWPTVEEVMNKCGKLWNRSVEADIIRCVPR